jgi:branched-chain amino acid aminotransferase
MSKTEQDQASAPWGSVFTDHIVTARYEPDGGWSKLSLEPYQPLQMAPSSAVFHYGQAVFEGLKAYHQPDNSVATFRPDQNAGRFARSARRLAMAELPEDHFLESLRLLVNADRDQVPTRSGESLYLRPLEIAADEGLLTNPSKTFLYVLMGSPVKDYFAGGVHPVRVWISTEYSRAMPGGTGEAKCAGNYAAAMLAQKHGADKGCDQVVWLDSVERRYVEEMGGMNLFFVFENRLVTPKLTGTLLPGVTRDSILMLGSDLGLEVEERLIAMDEWEQSAADGTLKEVFACGTAAVITPVGEVVHEGGSYAIGDGGPGAVTMKLRETLLNIQEGTVPDTHGWMHRLA